MRIKRRKIEVFNLSFLDVISCGFGAIILLLMISKITQPMVQQLSGKELQNILDKHVERLQLLQLETKKIIAAVNSSSNEIKKQNLHLEELKQSLSSLETKRRKIIAQSVVQSKIKEKLETAQQTLSEQMKQLKISKKMHSKNPIGGITVDSEYIIFVIDTSGSMQKYAWPMVRKKMQEILKIHPEVKGIQVLNDMGEYMFSQYARRWITDTPARRKAILARLASWVPFSNSSPEEGITAAIKHFYEGRKQIAIYILGDDYSRGSIQALLETVSRLNHSTVTNDKIYKTRVRINAIGFPVLFRDPSSGMNVARFAALMRNLAEENNGSFVGLNSLK